MGKLTIMTGYYYIDIATGFVYNVRPAVGNATQYAIQCFVHDAKKCEIISVNALASRDIRPYAWNFKDAFERYWKANKKNLMYINILEMKNYVKPKRKYRKSLGRAF